jgi:hypothetical protein
MFVLIMAAVDDQEVISGGLSIDPENTNSGDGVSLDFVIGWTQYMRHRQYWLPNYRPYTQIVVSC